jgi:hypothetical protein
MCGGGHESVFAERTGGDCRSRTKANRLQELRIRPIFRPVPPPIALTEQEITYLDFFVVDISFFTDRHFNTDDRIILCGKTYEILSIEPSSSTPRNPLRLPYNVIATPIVTDRDLSPPGL